MIVGSSKNLSLAEVVPDVIKYWSVKNKYSPHDLHLPKSNLLNCVLICPYCGKEFTKAYASIISGGCYCRACSKLISTLKTNNLALKYPEVAEWYNASGKNEKPANLVNACSNKKYYFKCDKCGHIYYSSLNSVCRSYKEGSNGCPVCAGLVVQEGINDITTKNKISALYWDYDRNAVSPTTVIYSDQNYRYFKCPRGHSFIRTPFRMLKSYNKDGEICPICSGKEVQKGENDLKSKNPLALKYWDYEKNTEKPEEVYYRSHKQYWFKCSEGHSFFKRPNEFYLQTKNIKENRVVEGCPVCGGTRLLKGYNDLYTKYKEIVDSSWDYERNTVSPEDVNAYSGKDYWWKCTKCGSSFMLDCDRRVRGLGLCEDCRKIKSVSSFEVEVYNSIAGYFDNIITQFKLREFSYDMYIPDKRIVIECNGVYWHSDAVTRYKDGKLNLRKLNTLRENNISLYVIWEDDWNYKKDVVLKSLYRKLGISTEDRINARDCTVNRSTVSSGLLNNYHIQGNVVGCDFLTLLNKDGSVVAELAYKRVNNNYYIVRYATSCIVRGGFSKLLKYISIEGSKVFTFSDNSISSGKLYRSQGFEVDSVLNPDYSYVYKDRRVHKFNFRKSNFKNNPNLKYEEGLTEKELANLNNLYRVYDYGKIKWVKYN